MKIQPNRFSNTLALVAPGALLLTGQAGAAFDAFLKIDGIDGESVDYYHKHFIQVESWSWGATQMGTSSGSAGGAGKVSMQDFSFSRRVDKASPALFLACATGQHIPTLTFTFTRPGKSAMEPAQDYYTITLTDVLVSSIKSERPPQGVDSTDGRPMESISLNFTKIEISYRAVNSATGELEQPITASADVVQPETP